MTIDTVADLQNVLAQYSRPENVKVRIIVLDPVTGERKRVEVRTARDAGSAGDFLELIPIRRCDPVTEVIEKHRTRQPMKLIEKILYQRVSFGLSLQAAVEKLKAAEDYFDDPTTAPLDPPDVYR